MGSWTAPSIAASPAGEPPRLRPPTCPWTRRALGEDSTTSRSWETGRRVRWDCKEAFPAFFAQADVTAAQRFFQRSYDGAVAVGNRPLTAVAEQLQRHLSGLLGYLEQHVTNAGAEALNSEIQAIKTAARGFRQFAGYRRAILFFLGGLDLCPHKGS